MSGRPITRLPLLQACTRHVAPRTPTRWLHDFPRRPPLRPSKPRPPEVLKHQRRSAGTFVGNARTLFRQYPISMTMATAFILAGAASIIYAQYMYQTYIIGAFHNYPEEVAKKLRKALYYTNTDLNPKEAIKYYKQALQVAEEIQMDPWSDEILGIKIQIAALFEKVEVYTKAIEVLERVRTDNLTWLELYGGLEHNKQKRTRVLAKTVAISVKLGDLYGNAAIWDREMAEERLVWAVETVLKEKQRRQNLNVKDEDEGPWMSDSEVGAALESLAHSYEEKDQHYLTTPLFLQALDLLPTKNCHAVILMNNLATSLAQQSLRAARVAQIYADSRNINERPVGPPATRETMVENARMWSQKALDVAAEIRPPERDEECDIGCAVAMHNLGEFAEMAGDVEGAGRRYREAVGLARAVGFQEGVENSSARLRKLDGKG